MLDIGLPPLYTGPEAMRYLSISRATLQRMLRGGILHGTKVSGDWRFTQRQLDACAAPRSEGEVRAMSHYD